MYMTREEVLGRLRATLRKGQPIVGTGAGIGLAARAEERGGADLIIVYGTGKYRMAGRSSMAGRFAFGNANDLVLKMAQEVMPVAPHTPVLAGVFIQDPFRDMMGFIEQLKQAGYSGVQNVPGMGGMDQMEGARTVTSLDAAGIGMAMELAFLRAAKDRGMVTTPYAYNLTQAVQLAANGSDMLCLHVGLTTKGLTAAQVAPPIERCAQMLSSWIEAIRAENPDTIILCHGGPIAEPQDFSYIMWRAFPASTARRQSSASRWKEHWWMPRPGSARCISRPARMPCSSPRASGTKNDKTERSIFLFLFHKKCVFSEDELTGPRRTPAPHRS